MTPASTAVRTIDVGRWDRIQLLLGAVLLVGLGGSAVVAAIGNLTTDRSSTGVRVALGVIGVPLLLIGGGLLIWRIRKPPLAFVDVTADGLALRHREGIAWQLRWDEVSSVRLVRARWRMVRTGPSAQLGWQRGVMPQLAHYFLWVRLRPAGQERLRSTAESAVHGRIAVDLGPQQAPARQLRDTFGVGSATTIEHLDGPESARVRTDAQSGLKRSGT